MILHKIDYNGGQIWVDKEAPIEAGITPCFNEVVPWYAGYTVTISLSRQFPYSPDGKTNLFEGIHKLVAQSTNQSPNLSLEGIPYVEIEEDIENVVKQYTDAAKLNGWEQSGFRIGYKAASAKKYTEEDLRKAFQAGRQREQGLHKSRSFSSGRTEDEYIQYIQSVNRKVVSVEIETRMVDDSEWNDEHTVCYREGDKEEIVTYQKDGKTFLKVKSIQYV